jgi:hypothetical protein
MPSRNAPTEDQAARLPPLVVPVGVEEPQAPTPSAVRLIDIVRAKRAHIERFASTCGAAGEAVALGDMAHWFGRPKGHGLKVLLAVLGETGVIIRGSSSDAIALPSAVPVDFSNGAEVRAALPGMCFVEIKSASQPRVKPGFSGFFFALTESEIVAAEALGPRHRVALYNKLTGELQLTSVAEILARAKSSNWQLSVQL